MSSVDTTKRAARKPMRVEINLFVTLGIFFLIVASIYMVVADAEPIGTVCFYMLGAMCLLVGIYLQIASKSTTPRYEDDPDAKIAERTGELGEFSPGSWAPLTVGGAATLASLAPVFGWWFLGLALAMLAWGMTDWLHEFSRGPHKH